MTNRKQGRSGTRPKHTLSRRAPRPYDVVIVGAGPAGVGMGGILREYGLTNFVLVDRHEVGASFMRWPREMRLITPSFTSNAFGLPDLNSVAMNTSPGFSLNREHPSGLEFAEYLRRVASMYELPIRAGVDVTGVRRTERGFVVQTPEGDLATRFVVWAAGEYQYPNRHPFPGAELCVHNTEVAAWEDLPGDRFTVIGGYESGADAAIALAARQRDVAVLAWEPTWESEHPDPSIALSPYTRERLARSVMNGLVTLESGARIDLVEQRDGVYVLRAEDGRTWESETQPILATGFRGSLGLVDSLLEYDEEGHVTVSEAADESTVAPGLFISGPMLRHRGVRFCFIYKYRQRFGVVGQAIASRLGKPTADIVSILRKEGMYLDDLSCCEESCEC